MNDIEKAMKEAHEFADRELKKARGSASELHAKVVGYAFGTVGTSRISVLGFAVLLVIIGAWFG